MSQLGPFLTLAFPFLCVFCRTTGLFVTAPVLAARFVPVQVKVGFSLVAAYFLWNLVPVAGIPETFLELAGQCLGEIAFGLAVGAIASMLMAAVEVAGHIVDVEMGFGLANVIDPELGVASPLMGTFKYLLITMVFLMLDGHHLFIRGLFHSFTILPAGAAGVPSAWAQLAIESVSQMFVVAAVLSCPMWASMLLTDVALGVMARAVPQLNVFVVGMPVKALVGLIVLSLSLGFYGVFTENLTVVLRNFLDAALGVFAR